MKRLLYSAFLSLSLLACGTDPNVLAAHYLQAAEEAFAAKQYSTAKLMIDSIKLCYPKAFETRRAGIKLLLQVELAEQMKSLAYIDSLLLQQQVLAENRTAQFVLERDTAYQEIGHYFAPSQLVEKNLSRSYLRAQVSERGEMALTSIYCGAKPLHHCAVKVTTADLFAQTPCSTDCYEFTNLGVVTEQAHYPLGSDGDVIPFIVQNKGENLRVTYIGSSPYTITLTAADRNAIAEVYGLAQLLSGIEMLQKERAEALRKKQFIENRLKNQTTEDEDR